MRRLATQHRRLEERETKIRRLVDANIIGIYIWELDGRVLEANDPFLHMVGYDREDLISGNVRWTDLTPLEWRDRTARAQEELEMTGVVQPFETAASSAATHAKCIENARHGNKWLRPKNLTR